MENSHSIRSRKLLEGKGRGVNFKKIVFHYRLEILPYRVFQKNNKYSDKRVFPSTDGLFPVTI